MNPTNMQGLEELARDLGLREAFKELAKAAEILRAAVENEDGYVASTSEEIEAIIPIVGANLLEAHDSQKDSKWTIYKPTPKGLAAYSRIHFREG